MVSVSGGVFECDIAYRRSVAVLCKLYKIRCNPMHPLYGVLPVPYLTVQVTRGALVAHRYILMRLLAAVPCSTAGPLLPSQCPCETIMLTMYSILCDWLVSRAGPMLFHWQKLLYPFLSSTIFSYFFFLSICWYCEAGVF